MTAQLKEVLAEIAGDAETDVDRYEGLPFTGKTLAMITGEQNAMIKALALTMVGVIEELDAHRV